MTFNVNMLSIHNICDIVFSFYQKHITGHFNKSSIINNNNNVLFNSTITIDGNYVKIKAFMKFQSQYLNHRYSLSLNYQKYHLTSVSIYIGLIFFRYHYLLVLEENVSIS